MEWAILGAASSLLLLLLILFSFSHPHTDDYSYNYILQTKGYAKGLEYLFQYNTGRFFSTLVIFQNPLKFHSIIGYRWFTAGLFVFFILSLFLFFRILLHQYIASKNIVILFAFVCLCFCAFMPNLHEFCYWLCGEATYLLAAAFWLWAIVLHCLLLQKKYENNPLIWTFAILISFAIAGCSEVGIFLYSLVLLLSYFYRRQFRGSNNRLFYLSCILFGAIIVFVFFAKGNLNRKNNTPFSGHVLLALSGGFYATGFWLSNWAIIFFPAICFYVLIFGHRLVGWAEKLSSFRFFKAKTVFISSLLFFLLCQILVVWMTGSTPEQRFENVLFLFLFLAFLLAAQLMMHEQAEFFAMLKKGNIHRGFKTLSFVYFISIFMVVDNNFYFALFDIFSGRTQQFAAENSKRDERILLAKDSILGVSSLNAQPKLLFAPVFSCSSRVDENDVPRMATANYFGKKWIYEYSCNTETPEYSIKEILKQKRKQFFSDKKANAKQ